MVDVDDDDVDLTLTDMDIVEEEKYPLPGSGIVYGWWRKEVPGWGLLVMIKELGS